MSAAASEDILGWLNGAIAKVEQDAARWHDVECEVHGMSLIDATVLQSATLCDCGGPASVLRRCAADRKLLELHRPQQTGGGFPDIQECRTCSSDSLGDGYQYLVPAPCPTLLALAEGYGWTGGNR